MLRDIVRVQHMLDSARLARNCVAGVDRATFVRDIGLQLQVSRCLEIVGEAAANVTEAYTAANPHLPWAQMIRMRNRLIHAYFDVNLNIIWQTVTEDLPALIPELQRLLQQEGL